MGDLTSIEPLEPRRLLTGVTLVTHGFGGSASDWVTAMGNQIALQSGPLASQPRYLMTATDNGSGTGPISVTSTRLGPAPANWADDEIVVLLDWSKLAGSLPFGGYHRTTQDVGAAVASKLLNSFSIPDLSAPLAQLPIHLIGHSRGASLISELAGDLGKQGVWVDEVTYLDPHPVDGVRDPLGFNFGDAPMHVYDNVQYAEDYWRTDGDTSFDFTGEPVTGAYNLQLSETILSDAGYSSGQHSDTHLWYHGTIGTTSGTGFQNSDGGASVGPDWYNAPQGPRDQTGWHYSRLARGTRPAAGLKSAGASRTAVALTASGASVWDDISISNLLSETTLQQGTSLSVSTNFEDRNTVGSRDATITLGFDRDDNPYNGVFTAGVAVATSSLATDALTANLSTSGIAGAFRVYAKISNGTTTRYYYAPSRTIVTVPGYTDTWTGPAAGNWNVATNWSSGAVPAAGDAVAIYDSAVALPAATTKIAGLLLGGSGTLDVGTHSLIIDYAAAATSPVGAWNGSAYTGLTGDVARGALFSSAVQANYTALGIASSADALGLSGSQTTSFAGQSVDATAVLIKYTYAGDANLDGQVNIDDYTQIDSSVAAGGSVRGWFNGDFNFDGTVNIDDYTLIDAVVGVQGPVL